MKGFPLVFVCVYTKEKQNYLHHASILFATSRRIILKVGAFHLALYMFTKQEKKLLATVAFILS